MQCDQILSIHALANRFNTFLDSVMANFTPLAVQPPGSFFTVPEHFLVDNCTVYKSLRLQRSKSMITWHLPIYSKMDLPRSCFFFHALLQSVLVYSLLILAKDSTWWTITF